jgi:hypothetical protein
MNVFSLLTERLNLLKGIVTTPFLLRSTEAVSIFHVYAGVIYLDFLPTVHYTPAPFRTGYPIITLQIHPFRRKHFLNTIYTVGPSSYFVAV